MDFVQTEVIFSGLRLSAENDQKVEIGRAYLYIMQNDLHEKPFGLMEDVFVHEDYRYLGVGTRLVEEIIKLARELGCYKLIATSRYGRDHVHALYQQFGFGQHGFEFRLDF